jgi:Putative Ig domain
MSIQFSRRALCAAFALLALSACGGGGEEEGPDPRTSTPGPNDLVVAYDYPYNLTFEAFAPLSIAPMVSGLGGRTPRYAMSDGTLPAGVSFDASTGVFSGVPVTTGLYTAQVTLSVDGYAGQLSAGTGFTVNSPFQLQYGSTPSGSQILADRGTAMNVQPAITGLGGGDTTTFAIRASSANLRSGLPAGVSIHPATGVISGMVSTDETIGSTYVDVLMTVTRGSMSMTVLYGGLSFIVR